MDFKDFLRHGRFFDDNAFDLHLHSTASDGSLTPEELASEVVANRLTAVALTDHDTLDGTAAFREILRELAPGITVLTGVELSITAAFPGACQVPPTDDIRDEEVHLLAYFDAAGAANFKPFLEAQRQNRVRRNREIIQKLNLLGYDITLEELYAGDPEFKSVRGRVHIAKLLVGKGHGASIDENFRNLMLPGRPAYVPRQKVTFEIALEAVREAGGLAVLAHPHEYGWLDDSRLMDGSLEAFLKIQSLARRGLDGLEVWHGDASPEQQAYLRMLAASFGLFPTGGSDYHGTHRPRTMFTPGRIADRPAVPVVAAGFERDGKILLARRPDAKKMGGLFEFPGGKLEPGETLFQALRRELSEELTFNFDLDLYLKDYAANAPSDGVDPLPDLVRLYRYEAFDLGLAYWRLPVSPDAEIGTREHSAIGFYSLDEAAALPSLPADAKILAKLKGTLADPS